MNVTAMILCGVALVIAIFCGYKWGRNIGILAMAFSWIIGAFFLKITPSAIIGYWPYKVAFRLMCVTFFYGFPIRNGTFKYISQWAIYKCRKATWFLPVAVYIITFAMSGSGAGPAAVSAFFAPIALALALQSGTNPIVYVAAVYAGGTSGSGFYFSSGGAVMKGLYDQIPEYADYSYQMVFSGFVNQAILHLIVFVVVLLVFKGFKTTSDVAIEAPPALGKKQKITLFLILACFILTFVPIFLKMAVVTTFTKKLATYMDIQFICIALGAIAALLKLHDEKEVITRAIPWNTIIMMCGCTLLISMASEAGITDLIAGWAGSSVPKALVIPLLTFVAGFLSVFSGAVSVVCPLLVPMVPALVAAAGLSSATFFGSMLLASANATAVSPFSTGGALLLAGCSDETLRDKLFVQQIGLAVFYLVVACIQAFVGLGVHAPI